MNTSASAVFWDVDGTLIASESLHAVILRELCAGYGLLLSGKECAGLAGASMDEKWARIGGDELLPISSTQWKSEFNAMYARRLQPRLGRPDTMAAVRRIHATGVTQGCVSNGEPDVVRANLEVLGIDDCFKFIIASADFSRGKPDPEPYLLASRSLGLEPATCIAVEDSLTGARSAVAAGCRTILWPEPETPAPMVEGAQLIRSSSEFPWELIETSNPRNPRSRDTRTGAFHPKQGG